MLDAIPVSENPTYIQAFLLAHERSTGSWANATLLIRRMKRSFG